MADPRTIAVYDERASDYAGLVKSTKPDAQLSAFLDLMPPGGRVLDLGCGPAHASAIMRASGLRPDPVDASAGMIAVANQTYDIGARALTFDDVDMVASYEGVWANFSLLHAPKANLPRHFAALARALTAGGILHVGMKTGSGEARDRIDRKYTYVTEKELHDLFGTAGFSVIGTDTGKDKGLDGTIAPWVVMRGRKNA